MAWVKVGEFDEMGKDAKQEQKRWEDVAEDVGLIPERNVRVSEESGKIVIEISSEMHDFFTGNY